jgi:hypothetical protein
MSTVKDDSFDDCNVIYSECCFTMGTRFHELSGKYKQLGKFDLAEKVRTIHIAINKKVKTIIAIVASGLPASPSAPPVAATVPFLPRSLLSDERRPLSLSGMRFWLRTSRSSRRSSADW